MPDIEYVTLREYFDNKLAEMEKRMNLHFDLLAEAVNKAETAQAARFASVNEFRALVEGQQRTFMPRAEAELRLKTLEDAKNMMKGGNIVWAYLIAIIGIVIATLAYLRGG